MSDLSKVIDSLEVKFFKLTKKLENLTEINENLTKQVNFLKKNESLNNNKIETLETELQSLRFTNSLLGSEENKRETKLKINSLISF